jgi:hypothetical protein
LLDKTIREFAQKIAPCESILVLDSNSLVIGQFFKSDEVKNILANSTPYFFTLNDSLETNTRSSHRMIIERGNKVFYFSNFQVDKSREPLYLLMMGPTNYFPASEIESFVNMLKNII